MKCNSSRKQLRYQYDINWLPNDLSVRPFQLRLFSKSITFSIMVCVTRFMTQIKARSSLFINYIASLAVIYSSVEKALFLKYELNIHNENIIKKGIFITKNATKCEICNISNQIKRIFYRVRLVFCERWKWKNRHLKIINRFCKIIFDIFSIIFNWND